MSLYSLLLTATVPTSLLPGTSWPPSPGQIVLPLPQPPPFCQSHHSPPPRQPGSSFSHPAGTFQPTAPSPGGGGAGCRNVPKDEVFSTIFDEEMTSLYQLKAGITFMLIIILETKLKCRGIPAYAYTTCYNEIENTGGDNWYGDEKQVQKNTSLRLPAVTRQRIQVVNEMEELEENEDLIRDWLEENV